MRYLGILDGVKLTEDFRAFLVSDILSQYKNAKLDDDDLFLGIGMMGFLKWVNTKSNCGVPGTLIIHCGRFLATIVEIIVKNAIERSKLKEEV